jgi:hypothetical protein
MTLSYSIENWSKIKNIKQICNNVIDGKIIDIISQLPFPIKNIQNPKDLVVIFTINNEVKVIHDILFLKKWFEQMYVPKEPTTNLIVSSSILSEIKNRLNLK